MLKFLLGTVLSSAALFHSLDPLSVVEHLVFYELYSDTPEGKQALTHAWRLLTGDEQGASHLTLPKFDLRAIISLVTRQPFDPPVVMDEEELELIEKIAAPLANRKLKGRDVWTKEELIALSSDEIDLARGIFLYQFDDPLKIRQYEANLDLIALQIRARFSKDPTPEEKIRAINRFIFEEMQFRFPPHSLSVQDIDQYTILPSVLDNREGVCLGVSILYLALAQRLDLSLEIITPPGHIYVRYRDSDKQINIETTARGIHIPDEQYLGINTRKLEERRLKEVIGMAFVNEASIYLGKQEYEKSLALYERALPFLPGDRHLDLLLGFNYLFVGKTSEGKKHLKNLKGHTFDHAVSAETLPDDYLNGRIDVAGIQSVFLSVDETRESIVTKQKELEKMMKRYPKFRGGLLQLATTWLQLGRYLEAQEILERYHKLDPSDCIVEYYLSVIALQRLDYNKAWNHLKTAEELVAARGHNPKALTAVRQQLKRLSP